MTGQWHHGPMLAFDVETTGPDPDSARIVTATLIRLYGPDRSPENWVRGTREYVINPDVDIPAAASAVHGITTEHARTHGKDAESAITEMVGEIGLSLHRAIPVVAFNAAYDLTVLDRECRRHGIDSLHARLNGRVGPVIDPFVLDKRVDTYRRGSRKLVDVAAHYGIDLREAHTSQADALAAAQVAVAIADAYPEVADLDLAELHRQQTSWRAQQCSSLQEYFRRKDPNAVVNAEWPMQRVGDDWDPAFHPSEEAA